MDAVRRLFVLTGGPGVGKSTTIEELASRGLRVVREGGRDLIREAQRTDPTFTPRKDPYRFRKMLIEEQIRREDEVTSGDAFVDVGLIENFVYAQVQLPRVPDEFNICLQPYRYSCIFMLDRPEGYALDGVRHESLDEARFLDGRFKRIYEALGYTVITVPVLSPRERADHILAHLPERD